MGKEVAPRTWFDRNELAVVLRLQQVVSAVVVKSLTALGKNVIAVRLAVQ